MRRGRCGKREKNSTQRREVFRSPEERRNQISARHSAGAEIGPGTLNNLRRRPVTEHEGEIVNTIIILLILAARPPPPHLKIEIRSVYSIICGCKIFAPDPGAFNILVIVLHIHGAKFQPFGGACFCQTKKAIVFGK